MSTKVIHIKDAPSDWQSNPDYVYIGRPGKGLSGCFGNPHPVGFKCDLCHVSHIRGEAVDAFEADFEKRIVEDINFLQSVLSLRDKTLLCFCKSKQEPNIKCHGDVYVEFLKKVIAFLPSL